MRFRWERLFSKALLLPVSIAVLVAQFLVYEFELSRMWAVPAGLWVAVQVQHRMNARQQQGATTAQT